MKITIIGGGNMASALISGMLKRGYAASNIQVVEVNEAACARLHEEFSVRATADLIPAVAHSNVLMLAVKPQQLREVALQIAPTLTNQLIISIAAGIRAEDIARWLGTRNLVRCMPNTPALIRCGVTALYALPEVGTTQRESAESILAAVGNTLWVKQEKMLDAVTAISGSGPAYVFYFIEAMQQAAREMGFTDDDAKRLVIDTFLGAAKLADSSPDEIGTLRARVTSKNGTTERALLSMETDAVKSHIIIAMHAAAARAQEMGDELGVA
jgi:pyrroline-5-carboxylate reductase